MELNGKQVLVVGLAVTGVPLVEVLHRLGARVVVNDLQNEEALAPALEALKGLDIELMLGSHPTGTEALPQVSLVVVSPGVPSELPFLQAFRQAGVEIIGEIELAYRLTKAKILAITGTNGKTTTTALTGAIFENSDQVGLVVGNIGVPAVSKALDAKPSDYLVMEASSFQLESVDQFHAHIGGILNLTPDHLNRHHTMENYLAAKWQVFKNQTKDDYAIVNYDDPVLRRASEGLSGRRLFFSRQEKVAEGAWVEAGILTVKIDGPPEAVLPVDEILIPGNHNLENALAAALMAYAAGISPEVIAKTLRSFKGVAHRIEFVDTLGGVGFINDSKGTNPDASIKAIEALRGPLFLLAGGMDKHSDFTELIQAFQGKVKQLLVYGETGPRLKQTALALGFTPVREVKDLEEAVIGAWSLAKEGDTILLSPACASWDMYVNFEERGNHFKAIVASLRGTLNGKKESL